MAKCGAGHEPGIPRQVRRGEPPLDPDSVARAAGLSESHFSRLIKEKTGRTFTDLMSQYRVDHAKAMLLRTRNSLIQIALDCGFDNQSYFSRVIKRHTKIIPSAYREMAP